MTNELEKQFFKCFGIEPRYEDACTVEDKYWDNEELANEYGTFDQYMNCKCGDQENCTTECPSAYQKEVYPEITDSILLKLFDILRKYYDLDFWTIDNSFVMDMRDKQASYTNIIYRTGGDFKNSILTSLNLIVKDRLISNDKIKHQVRTLFEDGNE